MRGFDVLDPHLDLKKSYFLEASAGTGKTFTIENLVLRLIQEGLAVDKILIVTFTRAATLELKLRIRKRLEEKKVLTALQAWDGAKIFTIHGFCFHTLKEHPFETGFSLTQNVESAGPDTQKRILKDFLRTSLPAEEIHPRQLEKVLNKARGSMEDLLHALIQTPLQVGRSYHDIQEEIRQILPQSHLDTQMLLELAPLFKGLCDRQGNVHSEHYEGFYRAERILKGDLEDLVDTPLIKMVPENLKQKKSYPQALGSLNGSLFSLLAEASNTDLILGRLSQRASRFLKAICSKEDLFFYDDLISKMEESLHNPSFVAAVRSEYDAVLIDEFQDTDPAQWKIFSTLFLDHLPLYLVGDPKQSIYRFRGADLYTYLKAKEALGESSFATLTRNFRSQPSLVEALNTLFQKAGDLIRLPKTGEMISIPPITAARAQAGEGKVIFCKACDEEALFASISREIARLKSEEGIAYRECAVLVKDRYQAQRFCARFGLPFVTKRNESLVESDAYFVLEDLLLASLNPRERHLVMKVLGGPLFGSCIEKLQDSIENFYRYYHVLLSKGIISFFQMIAEEVTFPSRDLFLDMWQLVEILVENTSSIEECLPYLQKLRLEDPDSEMLKTRAKCGEDAVQVMTLHVSKGLEFEAVFPVGLMLKGNMEEEEELSEKMRGLYVALTRAKRYLYLPVTEDPDTPIQYLMNKVLQGDSLEHFVRAHPNFCFLKESTYSPEPETKDELTHENVTSTLSFNFPPCRIHSYSSLTAHLSYENLAHPNQDELPAGSETGLVLHKVFEKLDFSLRGEALNAYLTKMLQNTILAEYLQPVKEIVCHTLNAWLPSPTGAFCLIDVNPKKMIREMEFLYPSTSPEGHLKGFIDLFFEYQGYYYCLDWKSNFLVEYTPHFLEEAIAGHGYALQASIYQTAVHHYLKLFHEEHKFVGSFYLFLRGLRAQTQSGIHFFKGYEVSDD